MDDSSKERLNKYLAFHVGVSRREADNLISSGKVKVNGEVSTLGARISLNDEVTINNIPVSRRSKYTYLMLNKPVNYVCSRKQQGESPTIYDLLPKHYHNLKTVGRLDRDSSGLILMTDDGDFTHRMTHPSFVKTKIYHVRLDKALEPLHQQMISDFGVQLEDGGSKLGLERLDDSRLLWEITMHEGRNRQIRRTFAALDYTVVELHRLVFGPYSLGDLKPGSFEITSKI